MTDKKPNEFGKAMQEWWDSDECKELQKSNEEAKQRAIGKYFMLSEEDKLDMVQAICYIMCKAEKKELVIVVFKMSWESILLVSGLVNLWTFIMLYGLNFTNRKIKPNLRKTLKI